MILGNMTGNYLAVSSATFLVGMTGCFWKCEKTFSHLGKCIRMLQINLHPFSWVRQIMLRCTEDPLMQNPSLLQTATVRTPLLGLHLPSLSLHFVANALCLHIFSLPWQPCNLPAGFIPSFASSPPAKEAKYSSLCSTSWCPDSVLADIFSALLLQMDLDKSGKL